MRRYMPNASSEPMHVYSIKHYKFDNGTRNYESVGNKY